MAATGERYYTPAPFEVDANGVPMPGAQLFFYQTGTSTKQNTYADVDLGTVNPNPVLADANGRFPDIFLIPSTPYKVQLWTAPTPDDPTGTQVWSRDPLGPGSTAISSSGAILCEVKAFAGPESFIPTQWYACDGRALSRVAYASAFAILGTTWGAGDGVTTFQIPDFRGRSLFGADNMGGAAANRLTSGISGIGGTQVGAVGGDEHAQADTITSTSVVSDPGHQHTNSARPAGSGVSAGGVGAWAGTDTANIPPVSPATTGITVATTSLSSLQGQSQNLPPAAVVNWIIFLGE